MFDDFFFRGGGALFSGLAISSLFALLPLLLGLAIPYAVLPYRDSRSVERDPQLGLKPPLYFSSSVSVLLFLSRFTLLSVAALLELQLFGTGGGGGGVFGRPRGGFTPLQRIGSAFMFAGFSFGLVQFVLIHMATNNRKWPLVRRVFGGWRMAVAGMVVLTMFTVLV